MRRFAVGLFLVLHGLAHSAAGMAAQDVPRGLALMFGPSRLVIATLLFTVAAPGFVASGFGCWGVRFLDVRWRRLARTSAAASALLLFLYMRSMGETGLGLLLDALAVVLAGLGGPLPERAPAAPAGGRS